MIKLPATWEVVISTHPIATSRAQIKGALIDWLSESTNRFSKVGAVGDKLVLIITSLLVGEEPLIELFELTGVLRLVLREQVGIPCT